MPPELKRKPRAKPPPYVRSGGSRARNQKEGPKTSAKPAADTKRSNLTLQDWMTVFAFMDEHPDLGQSAIVRHFRTKIDGALIFDQSTLSRKVKARSKLEERVTENPTALSSKRPRVVTRPDVERALVLWFQHMEEKRETVSGPMLVEKRKTFEKSFGVPENECLKGDGWVASFCKTYKIKEHRRHGEAGSVDLAAVEEERIRVREILAKYAPRDRWNLDETGVFPFAPPDRGLASKQMSGKKKSKFRITIAFACNADGSEKMPGFFIGKSKNPRCFKRSSPTQRGFYYRNNKKAWMTSELFEEWIKMFDLRMRTQNRRICLLVDNFSGHTIAYEPTNIELEFFEPNMTSFVQPLDAGIIRCFKALYRRAFCIRALDLDAAGEREIYKINLLEAMLMAKEAWDAVEPITIKHCWDHTGIQRPSITVRIPNRPTNIEPPSDRSGSKLDTAWKIVERFATDDNMGLPSAEKALEDLLGEKYVDEEWRPVLKAVMDAENDAGVALEAVQNFRRISMATSDKTDITIPMDIDPILLNPPASRAITEQCAALEANLLESVKKLQDRNRIFGPPPTLEELLDPVEEQEIGEAPHSFEGGDTEIVARVRRERAIANGEIIELDSDLEDEDERGPTMSKAEMMDLCARLEAACLDSEVECGFELSKNLRRFRAGLRQVELKHAKQITLDAVWGSTSIEK